MKENLKIFALIFALIISPGFINFLYAEDKTSVSATSEKTARQETEVSYNAKDSLMRNGYMLETDEQSASDSLERISGKIDMGYSSPENSFKSPDQYAPGPFAKEKAEEESKSTSGY